ncbi:MAG: tetratricopeptide repeat protein [Elusimicrobia bacterium]|nr:tetratricopeptide repeat protein [Elusimicrobiota bacterium]
MSTFGIFFVGLALTLNFAFPSSKSKNFNYWFEKGLNSVDSKSQIECYTQAINKWEDSFGIENKVKVYYNRGLAFASLSSLNDAINDYTTVIMLNPKYADAYAMRGNIYYRKKMCNEAISDYNKAIELNPNFSGAYNNRGVAYDDIGLYSEAIIDYNNAISLKPNYANAYHNRGITYYKKGQYVEAKNDFEKAKNNGYIYLQDVVVKSSPK